jgi:hypothetical protein
MAAILSGIIVLAENATSDAAAPANPKMSMTVNSTWFSLFVVRGVQWLVEEEMEEEVIPP